MYLNKKGGDLDNGCPTLQGQVGKRQPQSTTVLTFKGSNHGGKGNSTLEREAKEDYKVNGCWED